MIEQHTVASVERLVVKVAAAWRDVEIAKRRGMLPHVIERMVAKHYVVVEQYSQAYYAVYGRWGTGEVEEGG